MMARCEPSKSLPDKENVQQPQELEESFSSTISNAGSHSASFSGLEMMMTTQEQFMVDHGGNTDKEVKTSFSFQSVSSQKSERSEERESDEESASSQDSNRAICPSPLSPEGRLKRRLCLSSREEMSGRRRSRVQEVKDEGKDVPHWKHWKRWKTWKYYTYIFSWF